MIGIARFQRSLVPFAAAALLMIGLLAGSAVATAPFLPLLGIPMAASALLMLRRPSLAVLLFFVQLPFTSPLVDSFFPAKLQGGRPFFALLIVSVVHAWLFRNTLPRRLSSTDGMVFAILGLSFVSLFRSVIGFAEVFDLYLASTLIPLAIYLAVRPLNLTTVDLDRLLDALGVTAALIAALLCLERIVQLNFFNPSDQLIGWNIYATEATYRVSGPFVNPNNAGAFLVMGAALLARHLRGDRRLLVTVALATIGIAIFFTISRAAYLALALFVTIWQLHRGRLTRIVGAAIVGGIVAAMFAPFLITNETVSEGILNPSSWLYRFTLLETAWRMILSGPEKIIFGFGYENFRYLAHDFAPESFAQVPKIRGAGMPVHNDFLAIMIHYGVLGFGVFSAVIWKIVVRGLDLRRQALALGNRRGADRVVAVLAIVMVQLVMSTSHVPFSTYQLATLFWLAAVVLEHHGRALISPRLGERERELAP